MKKIRNARLQKLKNKKSKTEKSRIPQQNRSDVTSHISYTGPLLSTSIADFPTHKYAHLH